MSDEEKRILKKIDRVLKSALKSLYDEYELSESDALGKAIQDIADCKAELNNMY